MFGLTVIQHDVTSQNTLDIILDAHRSSTVNKQPCQGVIFKNQVTKVHKLMYHSYSPPART